MRRKLPASTLFTHIDKKVIATFSSLARKSGYDEPSTGVKYYSSTQMTKAFILYYLKEMDSLDDLECYLKHNKGARRVCNFQEFSPSRATLSRFRRTVGSEFFESLYTSLLKICKDKGLLLGRITAVDSTFIEARSDRKGEEKPELLEGKSCEFARVGRTHEFTMCREKFPLFTPSNRK